MFSQLIQGAFGTLRRNNSFSSAQLNGLTIRPGFVILCMLCLRHALQLPEFLVTLQLNEAGVVPVQLAGAVTSLSFKIF